MLLTESSMHWPFNHLHYPKHPKIPLRQLLQVGAVTIPATSHYTLVATIDRIFKMGHSKIFELMYYVIGIFISSALVAFGSNKFTNGYEVPKTSLIVSKPQSQILIVTN